MTNNVDPNTVLAFWFGTAEEIESGTTNRRHIWFGGDEAVDREIEQKFGALPPQALKRQLDDWRDSPRSNLALVLVLDQFTRNLYRGTPESFAYDDYALEVARAAIARGDDQTLLPIEAMFLFMPYEHSENIDDQLRCVELFDQLIDRAPPDVRERIASFRSYAVRHLEVIKRFGRFPHRNVILGRDTTDEEKEYLESGGDTF